MVSTRGLRNTKRYLSFCSSLGRRTRENKSMASASTVFSLRFSQTFVNVTTHNSVNRERKFSVSYMQ